MTVSDNLPSTYDPRAAEPRIRKLWEAGGHFRAEPADGRHEAYAIVIPPPNVTGALHGGHALNNTLQDILIRWRRMQGRNTLWMPGTDHAGIATQAVVERTIFEQEKKTRHDLGREEMVRRIWQWKETYGNRIIEQLMLMGCSCDWSRTRFTLDEVCAKAVRHTFFKLFRDGLIVRGKRLVNWDTHLQTAVADDEVYHETVKGHLWHIRYPLKLPIRQVRDGREIEVAHLTVATTRPETMLGDTAVAVHPDDPRWRPLIGKTVILPLLEREIPVIADPLLVDVAFGSGCVKVTPAHDPNDYACGQRHNLAMINILSPDGKINENGGPYQDMDRYSARKKVVADLEARGLIEKIEDHESDIGHSDRSKTPIEPYLSDQWFIRMGDLQREEASRVEGLRGSAGLAQLAMDMVCQKEHGSAAERRACGKVHFFPERYAKTYLDWLGEKRDWCISRQLWWGHRIPVWRTKRDRRLPPIGPVIGASFQGGGEVADVGGLRDLSVEYCVHPFSHVVWEGPPVPDDVALIYGERAEFVCLKEEPTDQDRRILDQCGFEEDPDVLDTWFSSALWPHSTMGWPESTPELKRYYPGSVLSTAREIITLWVARMVLTGMYNIGKVPFHDVYIHAVIQDGQGRPFKKTLGNGFDPVDIIETYGADALRYTMASLATETQDIRMPMKKVKLEDGREMQSSERFELGRNFCNKLWNAARFTFMNLEGAAMHELEIASLPIEDRWILSRVSRAAVEVQDALERFQFNRAVTLARDFFWDALCDWYLELVKPRIRDNRRAAEARQVLAFALDQSLRLLHPFIPFITEQLWQTLNQIAPLRGLPGAAEPAITGALVVAPYPPAEGWPALAAPAVDAVFDDLQTATRAIRDVRQSCDVPPKNLLDVAIKVPPERVASLQHEAVVIRQLARVGDLTIGNDVPRPANSATLVIGDMQIFVAGVIDTAAEKRRLEKDLSGLDKQIAGLEARLGKADFVDRAPAEVVERERQRLTELRAKRETMLKTMAELG